MTTASNVLAIARRELGTRGRADGTSKYGAWYERAKPAPGFAAGAWCQMFLSWCANEAGIPESAFPRMAYTPYAVAWFRQRGRWGKTPKVGALVYFNFPGGDAVDHVEIVEAVRKDGSIVTIGGNVANRVTRSVRRSNIAGYGYPAYSEPEPAKAKPEPNWTEALVKKLPTLRKGDHGWHVKTLTYLLVARDFAIDTEAIDDTVFTAYHEQGVKGLQDAAGIEVDGIVGPQTWPVLLKIA
ncbi:CHAP domain-containing protein [Nonomuraea sp. NPDC003560]|uniref:CHAP domain-containing protein n=1 Tax=Nonomuraea sp. NPDC003560 TaxID=3364341 RepID=UPI00367601F6